MTCHKVVCISIYNLIIPYLCTAHKDKKMKNTHLLLYISLFLFFVACKEDPISSADIKVNDIQVELNPSGHAPLSAEVRFSTSESTAVRLRVVGQHGADSDVVQDFPASDNFELPVLGLYPDYENQVELIFLDAAGNALNTESLTIQTNVLLADMPEIEVNTPATGTLMSGWNLVNYLGYISSPFPQRPFMFDEFGDIRWYVNYRGHPELDGLFCDYGMQQLRNGNLIFGNNNSGTLYEINLLGEVLNKWPLHGYGFHHTVIEKPNGNFLATVNDFSKPTLEDVILEIDRNTGEIANLWDLTESLDDQRRAWQTGRADTEIDWFHANGLAYSESDDCIIVSGRTQGTVKLTANNEVVWILAPHRDWATAGNGQDLQQYLLQPLDANGDAIEETAVLDGAENHPDFEWNWYQHSPFLMPNGNLMVFDNGENRNYNGVPTYSRGVEFQIDEANRTVQQIWQYGKERRGDIHSQVTSNVIYDAATEHVLFSPGSISFAGKEYGKVLEVDKASGEVLFEATILPPRSFYIITFHNTQKVELYKK